MMMVLPRRLRDFGTEWQAMVALAYRLESLVLLLQLDLLMSNWRPLVAWLRPFLLQ
jgi:hypothetical protein